jgi:hypothetical protein
MVSFLTSEQQNIINYYKGLIKTAEDTGSLVICRKYVQTGSADPVYGTGMTLKYIDNIIQVRLMPIPYEQRIFSVGGIQNAASHRMVADIGDKTVISAAHEIILNHTFSLVAVTVPSNIDASSETSIVLDLGGTTTTKYTNYDTNGMISGDKYVVVGNMEVMNNMWDIMFTIRAKDVI